MKTQTLGICLEYAFGSSSRRSCSPNLKMHADILRVSNDMQSSLAPGVTRQCGFPEILQPRLLLWRKMEPVLSATYTAALSETKFQTLSSLHHALLPSAPFRRQGFQMYQDMNTSKRARECKNFGTNVEHLWNKCNLRVLLLLPGKLDMLFQCRHLVKALPNNTN